MRRFLCESAGIWRDVGDHGLVSGGVDLDALLEAAREGSAWAFTDIWAALAPPVLGFLRSRGSREPEDLTSEVFLAAFRALPRFTGDGAAFRGLIFTIAQRRFIDELRVRGRCPVLLPLSDLDDGGAAPSAEDCALSHGGDQEARTLLDALAPDQRDVLTLRIFGDLTVEQVATALGKSVGAVKQLQRRGLETLRRRGLAEAAHRTGTTSSLGHTPGAVPGDARERS